MQRRTCHKQTSRWSTARVPQRVRIDAPDSSGAVPTVPSVAARVDAATADPIPAADQPEISAACEKLAEDAAQTTLMVVEFQRWYREQREAIPSLSMPHRSQQ